MFIVTCPALVSTGWEPRWTAPGNFATKWPSASATVWGAVWTEAAVSARNAVVKQTSASRTRRRKERVRLDITEKMPAGERTPRELWPEVIGFQPTGRFSALAQRLTQRRNLAGAAEQLVAAGDELGVFLHENLPGGAEIELCRLVAEKFAMNAGPDEAAFGVDIDLSHAARGGGKVLVDVHAHGAGVELAAGGVDALALVGGDAGGAMHNDGEAGDAFFDAFEHLEVKRLLALEFIGAVAGADGGGE